MHTGQFFSWVAEIVFKGPEHTPEAKSDAEA